MAIEFRALDVRVLAHRRRGWVWLRVICADTLMEPTAPPSSAHAVDLEALPLGRREDGSPWRLRLLGRHVLMAGASGSGKSSMVAGLLVALAPAIREGLVRVIGDPDVPGRPMLLLAAIAGRQRWRAEYTAAQLAASGDLPCSATEGAAA